MHPCLSATGYDLQARATRELMPSNCSDTLLLDFVADKHLALVGSAWSFLHFTTSGLLLEEFSSKHFPHPLIPSQISQAWLGKRRRPNNQTQGFLARFQTTNCPYCVRCSSTSPSRVKSNSTCLDHAMRIIQLRFWELGVLVRRISSVETITGRNKSSHTNRLIS